ALWYAFLLAGVVPLLPTLADEGAATIARVLWRLLALVALVYVVRNAVLRARESHADLRADVSGGAAGIRRVLAGLRARRQGPLRLHPSPSARLAVLDDTDQLFRPGIWEALTAGVVLTLVYHELVTLIGFYVTDPLTTAWLAALAVAPVVGAVVSIGLWRAAFAAAVRGVAFRAAAV